MKKILLGTTLLFGLAGTALATTPVNTIAINDGSGSVGSLAIDQSGTAAGTVSADGTNAADGTPTRLAITGPWNSIAITQTDPGDQVLKGTSIKSDGTSGNATLVAGYTTTTGHTGGNVHTLNIGATTAPLDPSVTISLTNSGSGTNTVADTLDGSDLTYNLAISGTSNTLTNNVKANGAVTLTKGGSSSAQINGSSNTIDNEVGQTDTVGTFEQTLLVMGDSNHITNTVNGNGDKTVDQSVTGGHNVIATTVSGDGEQTANLILSGNYVDYGITSAADTSYANVSLSGVGGVSGTPDVVRVQQTSNADGATATLTVVGGGFTMGNLTTVPGTYNSDTLKAGVAVYQNSSGAYLNASVTGGANGYTAVFKQ